MIIKILENINQILKRIGFVSFLLLGIIAWSHQANAEINIEASVNPSKAVVGEPIQLSIVVTGAGSGIQRPKIPNLELFRTYSQGHSEEVSFLNGKMSSRSVFTYVLVPNTEGKHVIDAIEVPIGGNIFKTGSLEIEVTDGMDSSSAPSRARQSQPPVRTSPQIVPPASRTLPPEFMTGQEIFVRANVDRQEVYVNQPVYLLYTLYTRASATFKGFEEEPVTTGFWVEDFKPKGLASREEKIIGGHRYVIADVRTMALFPTESGNYTLDPGVLKVDVEIRKGDPFSSFYSRDIFGRRRFSPRSMVTEVQPRLLQTEPIKLTVKPFPEEGKPESFTGAVGHFKIESSLEPTNVEVGHPVTHRIRLTGEGNLNTVELPVMPDLDFFKYYDGASGLNMKKDRQVVEGEKIKETVMVPKKAGSYVIPALKFAYFDPMYERYVELSTSEHHLTVEASSVEPPPAVSYPSTQPVGIQPDEPLQPITEDILYLKDGLGKYKNYPVPYMLDKRFWYLNAGLLAGTFLLLLFKALLGRIMRSSKQGRPRKFAGGAKRKLRSAKSHLKTGHERQFYEELSAGMYGYFANRLGLEMSAVSVAVLDDKLSGQLDRSDMEKIKRLFAGIDYGRFSTAVVAVEEMKDLYKEAVDLLNYLDRKKIR